MSFLKYNDEVQSRELIPKNIMEKLLLEKRWKKLVKGQGYKNKLFFRHYSFPSFSIKKLIELSSYGTASLVG